MIHPKNKYTEEYKRQKIFPKEIGKHRKVITHPDKSSSTFLKKMTKTYINKTKEIDFKERLELLKLREENHRLMKDIENLIETILILGSKMKK